MHLYNMKWYNISTVTGFRSVYKCTFFKTSGDLLKNSSINTKYVSFPDNRVNNITTGFENIFNPILTHTARHWTYTRADTKNMAVIIIFVRRTRRAHAGVVEMHPVTMTRILTRTNKYWIIRLEFSGVSDIGKRGNDYM